MTGSLAFALSMAPPSRPAEIAEFSKKGSQNARGGTSLRILYPGPRAHACAGPALVGNFLPTLPTGPQAGHLGPLGILCVPARRSAGGPGGTGGPKGGGPRWQAHKGPFACQPGTKGAGPAGTKAAPKGPPGGRGLRKGGTRLRRKHKGDTQTDTQTLNSSLVVNIVVQVWQPPLRGCTWSLFGLPLSGSPWR